MPSDKERLDWRRDKAFVIGRSIGKQGSLLALGHLLSMSNKQIDAAMKAEGKGRKNG